MLVLEKTATTTLQRTVYLEYRNVIIENLGANDVKVMTAFHDLRGKMVDEGAVMDTCEAYGMLIYEQLKPRFKKKWWGLRTEEIHELGYLQFKTASGSSNLRITAYNGHVGKVKGGTYVRDIKTLDEINIIIDKLTQEAYTERRSSIRNDEEPTSPSAPSNNLTNTTHKGKFFPRGMRGFIRNMGIYCKRTGSGSMTLAFSPQVGMGEVDTFEITPTSNWSFVNKVVNKFWNYDSLFVWVKTCDADVSFGYDTETPYDAYTSADSGVTWGHEDRRYHIRALYKGQTVGDVPISGTLNTVDIPSLSGVRQAQTLVIPAMSYVYDTTQLGAGRTLCVIFTVVGDTQRNALRPIILCDGNSVLPFFCSLEDWYLWRVDEQGEGIYFSKWDSANQRYALMVTIKYPFRSRLQIGFYNESDSEYSGIVGYSYEKIN